jgi:prophage regulatory protein
MSEKLTALLHQHQEKMDRVLRLREVIEVTGLSRSAIYSLETFPRQVPLSNRAVGWLRSEVMAWVAARVAARDAKASTKAVAA